MKPDLDRLARALGLGRASSLARPAPDACRTALAWSDDANTPTYLASPSSPAAAACLASEAPLNIIERRWPATAMQGRIPLSDFLGLPEGALRRLSGDAHAPDLGHASVGFLDCETTGLRAGPGCYAFLVGLGTFDEAGYRLRQFFLADPSGEPAMLEALRQALSRLTTLVTFNGRTFDWPFLESRVALDRSAKLPSLFHLDLLPISRRIYRRRVGSCRLVHLEASVLDLHRVEDVPSSEVPAAYFRFVHDRDARALELVLEHNATDIVSLASLAACVHATLDGHSDHPLELLGAATCLAARKDDAGARALLERAIAGGLTGPVRREAHRWMARLCRRAGLLDQARHHLSWLVELGTLDAATFVALCRLDLACGDGDAALEHCRAGLRRLSTSAAILGAAARPGRERLRALLARLEAGTGVGGK